MLLKKQAVSGRAFLLQFIQIMQEFGVIIPWLKKLKDLPFYTNSAYFEKELYRILDIPEGRIVPYQFLTSGIEKEFFGGCLHFSVSPEKFKDKQLANLQCKLELQGSSFLSCLYVRDIKRGQKIGTEIMQRVIKSILDVYPNIWGVCERELIDWYVSLGAIVLNNGDNSEKLALINWRR